jgi:hypothetical protein
MMMMMMMTTTTTTTATTQFPKTVYNFEIRCSSLISR